MQRLILGLILLAFPFHLVAMPAPAGCDSHFLDGEMPDIAVALAPQTQVVCFSAFAVLHSGVTKTPLWSAERLTPASVASATQLTRPSSGPFHAESKLPTAQRATLNDYRGTGFDRGHMAPSGNMPTKTAQIESFSLANIVPQQACNNEETWEGIESGLRKFVSSGEEVFVITGPVFDPSFPPPAGATIGQGVAVPTRLFKAVYVVGAGTGAAYLTTNIDTTEFSQVSFAEMQAVTGIDLFPKLAVAIKQTAAALPPPSPPSHRCRLRR